MEYIKLANAHVTQLTTNAIKSEWSVEANITNEVLGKLPSNLNEKQVFQILDWARKYELEAFNVGIEFGKKEQKRLNEVSLEAVKENIRRAVQENERLADALETATSN